MASSPEIAQPVVASPAMYVCTAPVDVQVQYVSGQYPCEQANSQSPERLPDWPSATVPALQSAVVLAVEAAEAWVWVVVD